MNRIAWEPDDAYATMAQSSSDLVTQLSALSPNGRARAAALGGRHVVAGNDFAPISFRSRGKVLVLGPPTEALEAAARLGERVRCAVLLDPDTSPPPSAQTPDPLIHLSGRLESLEGYLGEFTATISVHGRQFDVAQLFGDGSKTIDLVLDLATPPRLTYDTPPLGYYAPGGDADALDNALVEIPELVGEFEKPRYFDYDPSICAHGRSGLQGCRRCIDACPTQAIRSQGDTIEVDPHLCQGAGSCAMSCPSGAITYAYPALPDLLTVVRDALRVYREAGGTDPQVMFFDREHGEQCFRDVAPHIPEFVLPFELEEIGASGMDAWLAALAYGAERVVVLATRDVAKSVLRELSLQMSYASSILASLNFARDRLGIILDGENHEDVLAAFEQPYDHSIEPASFTPFDEKRTTIRLAVEHLHAQATDPRSVAPLPDGAPFGEIQVDREACTLCMACGSVCPTSAIVAGDERPRLGFIEANCVQCGLCHQACPEDAIRLSPRIAFEREFVRSTRTLHEEEPFHCIVCGKPFATQAVMDRMAQKLSGHWMFQNENAMRRLKMCEECRVRDAFDGGESINVYDKPDGDGGSH